MDKIITAPDWAKYLGSKHPETGEQFRTEIPANCVLSKGITGCGATTLGIEQAGHTIIAMPFVGLIDNKTAQYPDTLLGIHGRGSKEYEIKNYLDSHDTVKIATTFDSLRKVCDTLASYGFNAYKDAHLLVDEWHVLFNAYDYRYAGVRKLLETAPLFDRVTYISATPIERRYYLEELKHLPEYRIEWPTAKPVNIRSHKVDKPLEYMAGICRNRIANGGCNYHIFLNSGADIGSIIRCAKLTPENTRVICSQSEETLRKNLAKLPEGFSISKALDELKPISFYTSTCFEGQDIIDPNGRSFIVSHAQKDHTMLDISTTFIQICGRIRTSAYNDEIVHFYSTNRYMSEVSLEDFENATNKTLMEAEQCVDWLNSAPERMKPKVIQQLPYFKEPYIKVVGNEVMIDRNMANFDIVNYKIVNNIYQSKCNVINEIQKSGATVTNDDDYTAPEKIQLMAQRRIGFKDLFDLYCSIVESPINYSLTPDYRLEQIESSNSLVTEAYRILGKDEVRRMNYHQSNIRRELIKRNGKALDYKIVDSINEAIPLQKSLPVAQAKRELQGIYDDLGVKRKAKASDLREWYEIKEHTKTINGKSAACLTIIRPKLVRISKSEI